MEIATSVTTSIKGQGKFDPKALAFELDAAEMTLDGDIVRWMVGKELTITSEGDIYGRKWDVERYESILNSVMEREYHKNLIFLAIKEGFTSVEDINDKIGLDLKLISHLLADLEKTGMVKFTGMEDRIPAFVAL